jgi:hypothetical protein
MKRLMMLIILISMILSGCASTEQYCKGGATQTDFQRDRQDCINKTRDSGFIGSMSTQQKTDYYNKCMETEKGWSKCTE